MGVILKNCAVDVVRLDSCLEISRYKDSILIESFKMLEYQEERIAIHQMRDERFHEIISNQTDLVKIQEDLTKIQKKKTTRWKLISGGLTVLLVLVIL